METKNRELFNSVQEFCTIELKIQVIPVENISEVAQYLERFVSLCDST
jgi:hypothetical protein